MVIMRVPNHVAIILDGNRRWACARGMLPWEGHRYGAEKFDKFLDWCIELGIPHISAWVLSTENLNRSKTEVRELGRVFYEYLEKWEKEKKSLFEKYQIRVRFIGDLERLSPKLLRLMGRIMRRTAKYQKKMLNILIAYGGKFELLHVFKKIAEKAIKLGRIEITEKDIDANLLVPVPVDLMIRTGGFKRLSNFLLWQTAYAEIYFTKTLWPDFSKRELIKAIKWYNSTQRNFGR